MTNKLKSIHQDKIYEANKKAKNIIDTAFLTWTKPENGTPNHIREAAITAIKNGLVDGYSDNLGLVELRNAVITKLKNYNNISASLENIIITSGAIQALSATIYSIINYGDEVIIPSPGYSMHISLVKIAGGIVIFAPTNESQKFELDLSNIQNAITRKTKAILLCNPNNPTGNIYSPEQLIQIIELAEANDLYVITDESYEQINLGDKKHCSIASLKYYDKIISCFSFTKTYSMTGWRIGYLFASEGIINQIIKVHINTSICAPVVSQYAALAAITGPQEIVEINKNTFSDSLNLICKRLNKMGGLFEYYMPEAGYSIFPRFKYNSFSSKEFCDLLMNQLHITSIPGILFGPEGENHVRFSFGGTKRNIDVAFDRMESFFI